MKGIKCLGLSILFAIPLLSLCQSLDVSALKHSFSRMPLYQYQFVIDDQLYGSLYDDEFSFSFSSSNKPTINFNQTEAPFYFSAQGRNNSCYYNGSYVGNGHWIDNGNQLKASDRVVYSNIYGSNNNSFCQQNHKFGENGMYNFDWGSLPFNSAYSSLKPYSYNYASYTYSDSWISPEGVVYDSIGLSLSDILGWDNTHNIIKPKEIKIPIGDLFDIGSSDFVRVERGTSLHFYYEIYITDISPGNFDISNVSNSTFSLVWSGLDENLSVQSGSQICSKDVYYDGY